MTNEYQDLLEALNAAISVALEQLAANDFDSLRTLLKGLADEIRSHLDGADDE